MSGTSKLYAEIDAKYADRIESMSEEDKMLVGLPYLANTEALIRARIRARRIQDEYNKTGPTNALDTLTPTSTTTATTSGGSKMVSGQTIMSSERQELLSSLFGISLTQASKLEIEPPLYVDYGTNIKPLGSFYANYNTVILDTASVTLGDGVLFGPNVSIYCGTHSVSVVERKKSLERSLPVTIGQDTWVGGGTIILAGVNIGQACTIGAGSVVTKHIPDWSVALGNPCRVVRTLSQDERA